MKLILFDVGGVLLHLNHAKFYSECAKLSGEISPEQFKAEYVRQNLDGLAHTNAINSDEYVKKLGSIIKPSKPLDKNMVKKLLLFSLGKPIAGNIKLKRMLYESGYAVGIFSNISELSQLVVAENLPEVFETYDDSSPKIFSFRVGSAKPDPGMYRQIRGFESVTFIDDKKIYLNTGVEQFGWNGIWFKAYIDENEASRVREKTRKKEASRLKTKIMTAISVEELTQCLKDLGIVMKKK